MPCHAQIRNIFLAEQNAIPFFSCSSFHTSNPSFKQISRMSHTKLGKLPLAVRGTVCHTPSIGSVEVLPDHLLVVAASGTITHLGPPGTAEAAAALTQAGLSHEDIYSLTPTQFLLPGFIDSHFHAPQYSFTGVGTDLPLFDWLHTYTFPCEAGFADRAHAEAVYRRVVRRLLRLGTTTANFFTTLHPEACQVLG